MSYGRIAGRAAYPTLGFTFTVPAQWQRVWVDGVLWGEGARLGFFIADNVYADPCDGDLGLRNPALGGSVDDLVRALTALPGLRLAGEVEFDEYFGFPGHHLILFAPAGAELCHGQSYLVMHTLGNPGYVPAGAGEQLELWVLSVEGTRVVIIAHTDHEASRAVRLALTGVVHSIQITP